MASDCPMEPPGSARLEGMPQALHTHLRLVRRHPSQSSHGEPGLSSGRCCCRCLPARHFGQLLAQIVLWLHRLFACASVHDVIGWACLPAGCSRSEGKKRFCTTLAEMSTRESEDAPVANTRDRLGQWSKMPLASAPTLSLIGVCLGCCMRFKPAADPDSEDERILQAQLQIYEQDLQDNEFKQHQQEPHVLSSGDDENAKKPLKPPGAAAPIEAGSANEMYDDLGVGTSRRVTAYGSIGRSPYGPSTSSKASRSASLLAGLSGGSSYVNLPKASTSSNTVAVVGNREDLSGKISAVGLRPFRYRHHEIADSGF